MEDDVLVRSTAAAFLRECGFDVIEGHGADEAIRVLQAEIRVDIVFSDIQMPGSMDGFGLSRWAPRAAWLKVILTSGAARAAKEAGDLCEHGRSSPSPTTTPSSNAISAPCWHADKDRFDVRLCSLVHLGPSGMMD